MTDDRKLEPRNTSRGYTVELREEEDGSWTALVPELPGCVAVGDSPSDAVEELPDVIDLWVATAEQQGVPVPRPRREESVSGRFLLRLPKSLHRQLTETARAEGVSLNTYCVSALAGALGVARAADDSLALARARREAPARRRAPAVTR